MLLQTLRTRDPDELAEGFRQWELRFPAARRRVVPGRTQVPSARGIQTLRASCNRIGTDGSKPLDGIGLRQTVQWSWDTTQNPPGTLAVQPESSCDRHPPYP